MLGTFIGNGVNLAVPWSTILDTMHKKFEILNKTHPTLEGWHLLIQMYGGGPTKFLTRVHGMPDSVIKQVQKMI